MKHARLKEKPSIARLLNVVRRQANIETCNLGETKLVFCSPNKGDTRGLHREMLFWTQIWPLPSLDTFGTRNHLQTMSRAFSYITLPIVLSLRSDVITNCSYTCCHSLYRVCDIHSLRFGAKKPQLSFVIPFSF
jgi:hypothetical protein